jgi:hypothetical protein
MYFLSEDEAKLDYFREKYIDSQKTLIRKACQNTLLSLS